MSVNRHPNTQGVTIKQWRYTATGGETTLSGTDGFSQSLTYTPGAEEVFVNGVLLVRGTDYTASTGTTVVLNNALVAGDIATVSAPSVFNVANSIPSSTVTAKGDLLVANGSASLTNLAVGADGSTLVANSSAGGGVSWAGPTIQAGKNALINGGMDIWQRGVSFNTNNTTLYTADRWTVYTSTSTTISQETSVVPTGYKYAMKALAGGSSTTLYISQTIETLNSLQFAGQTVTFSAYVSASTATNMTISISYSTNVDNASTGSWTYITSGNGNAGTSGAYARISGTTTVPSNAKSLLVTVTPTSSSTIASGVAVYVTGVQLELGSVPTAFSRAGGTLQGELAACQRYYVRWQSTLDPYQRMGFGSASSTTRTRILINLPVLMRGSGPSATDYSTLAVYDGVTVTAATAITLNSYTPLVCEVFADVASGLTQYRPYQLLGNNSTSAYIGLSAEL